MRWYLRGHDGNATECAPEDMLAGTPLVSVVITTRNRPVQLAEAVRSVLANTVRAIEVLVVDQSDGSETRTVLETCFGDDSRVAYLADSARGSSRGRNLGLAHARADVVAITDDDCLVAPTWIASLLAAFAGHPDVALVFGEVNAPPYDYLKLVVPLEILKERRIERGLTVRSARLEGISAHMALRRELVEEIGGFDPCFGVGGERWSGEDYELHYRALRAGYAVLIEPGIAVTHVGMRPMAQAWALWRRDALGCGALAARLVRDGQRGEAWCFWWWNIGRVLANAFFHTISFQHPTGTRLAFWMIVHSLRGFAAEWREPGEPMTAPATNARAQSRIATMEQAAV